MQTFRGDIEICQASAGSGKTTYLVNKFIEYVQQGVQPEEIAIVTFTKIGAQVLQERLAIALGVPMSRFPHVRTIHSMCFRSTKSVRTQMMDLAKYRVFNEATGFNVGTTTVVEGIDWADIKENQYLLMEQLYRNNHPYAVRIMEDRVDTERLVHFMTLYQKYKEANNYRDFTDLLDMYINDDLYEEDVKVAMIDEAQDTSLQQWNVLYQAFPNAYHIHIVGDIKQAMFRFAGASPETLLKMRGMPKALDLSYRVPQNIMQLAYNNIVQNMNMRDMTQCRTQSDGGTIKYITLIDEVADDFTWGESWFILVRNRKLAHYATDWCMRNTIPYVLYDKPYFTDTDKMEFRDGRTDDWDPEKLMFAQKCYEKGVFYRQPNVRISTIHTVKGDEADNVVLFSDISRLVSSGMEVDADSEHCVFYVATTRARKKLFIVEPQTKLYYPYLF